MVRCGTGRKYTIDVPALTLEVLRRGLPGHVSMVRRVSPQSSYNTESREGESQLGSMKVWHVELTLPSIKSGFGYNLKTLEEPNTGFPRFSERKDVVG